MIDFHSHILPNIDDGSINMEETINLINEAYQVGFTGIVCSSHYIQGYYECDCNEREKLLKTVEDKIVKKELNQENDKKLITENLNLYLASEIYITPEIIELIENKKASTINNTKYVLFELPMNSKPLFAKEIVYKLIQCGYKPIIAHPERYSYVKEDIDYVEELKNMGALFQSNYGSVIGMYGNSAKRTVKQLLKKDLVSFMGSDVHRVGQIYYQIPKIIKKMSKIISTNQIENITKLNAKKVINNEEI